MARALVVDDSRSMRAILARMLREKEFLVDEAGNGRQALDCLEKGGAPDLCVVDWNMPEMDGLSLVEAIRRDPRYAAVPILMVTTETEADKVERALLAGAGEYLMKPFTKEMLFDKLALMGFEG